MFARREDEDNESNADKNLAKQDFHLWREFHLDLRPVLYGVVHKDQCVLLIFELEIIEPR